MSSPERPRSDLTSSLPKKVVVIGFGSPIRGDDALGPLAAEQLADQALGPQVVVLSRHILTAEMATELSDATLVLFVDASLEGPQNAVVEHVIVPRQDSHEALAHSVDPAGLLAWTASLFGNTPSARLLSVRAATLAYANYELSPQVQATLPDLLQRLQRLIRDHLDSSQPHGSYNG